jgi:hypothetical protein
MSPDETSTTIARLIAAVPFRIRHPILATKLAALRWKANEELACEERRQAHVDRLTAAEGAQIAKLRNGNDELAKRTIIALDSEISGEKSR